MKKRPGYFTGAVVEIAVINYLLILVYMSVALGLTYSKSPPTPPILTVPNDIVALGRS
jgi:hypothetical protein